MIGYFLFAGEWAIFVLHAFSFIKLFLCLTAITTISTEGAFDKTQFAFDAFLIIS